MKNLETLRSFIDSLDHWDLGEEVLANIALEFIRLSRSVNNYTDAEGKAMHPATVSSNAMCHLMNLEGYLGDLDEKNRTTFAGIKRRLHEMMKQAEAEVAEYAASASAKNVHPINDINVRKQVWQLTGGKCAYCECDLAPWGNETADSFAVEHVVPRSQGGPDNLANYVPACRSCNVTKKDGHVLDFIQRKLRRNLRVIDGDKNAAGGTD